MDAELVQLAREAVAALRQPNWAEIAALGIGFGQLVAILGGLWMMNKAANVRNRQLDIMEANQKEMGQALRDQSEALRDQGQALRDQSEALAELLRRTV